jgi:glycosyltransferase involved in cell wall biosynthesis
MAHTEAAAALTDEHRPTYSVVIPVYRSAATLPALLQRLDAFFAARPVAHEIIFVNDGSPDESWDVLRRLQAGRRDVVIIDLMRNCGQHSAVLCGFAHARGDFVITMDDDLQNPPEEMAHLMRKIDEGYDVVFGAFHQKQHGRIRRLGTVVVDWLNRKLFHKPRNLTLTNFRILRHEVVEAVRESRSSFPYIPGLVLMNAKSFANVPVEHHPRQHGQSNYGAKEILQLVWRIVFNYSAFPLRLLCGIGVVMALASFLIGGFYLAKNMVAGVRVPGWTTLVVLLSFYQGLTLVIFAAIGEYVVRIVNDVSGPRAYRVREKR